MIQVRYMYISYIFCCRVSSESDVSGLNVPADQSFQVTFHAIVPINLWGWSDKHEMFLVFGIQQLGYWRKHVGDFGTPNRYV